MPTLTRKGVRPLLRQVEKKPHASNEDHEVGRESKSVQKEHEQIATRHTAPRASKHSPQNPFPPQSSRNLGSRRRIDASPMSSEEEPCSPPVPRLPSISAPASSKTAKSMREPKTSNGSETSTLAPRGKRVKSIKAPKAGVFEIGRAERKRRTKDENKENMSSSSTTSLPSSAKRPAEDENVEDMFGMAFSSSAPKKQRVQVENLFAPASKQKTFGKQSCKKPSTYGSNKLSRMSNASARSGALGSHKDGAVNRAAAPEHDDADSCSDVSMVDDAHIRRPRTKKEAHREEGSIENSVPDSSQSRIRRPNLADLLSDYGQDLTQSSQASESGQLELEDPKSRMSTIKVPLSSIGQNPHPEISEEVEGDTTEFLHVANEYNDKKCPLCQSPVDQEHYSEFWAKAKKTVRQQTIFCNEHKKREALEQYTRLGYPLVDWDAMPSRIQSHRRRLLGIIHGESSYPSGYRDEHAARMETGERKNLRRQIQESDLIDTKTGYYGSRGRRFMMETLTKEFGNDIRKVSKNDPVVAFGGISDFVLRVLVPELTICLVKDDFKVSDAMAKQTVTESGDLGLLVNEEIEDVLENIESEDDSDS